MTTQPPSNPQAERIVLGAMMTNPAVVDELAGKLTARAFYLGHHAAIYQCISEAHAIGDPTEPNAIAMRLSAKGALVKVGGGPYLFELLQSVPTTAQAGWYAEKIVTAAAARDMEVLGIHAQDYAHTLMLEDPETARQRIQDELDNLATNPDDDDPVRWGDIAVPAIDAIEAAAKPDSDSAAISTGLVELDNALGGGLRAGQLIIVAGRTGMGKSVLSRNFVRAAALHTKLPTLVFTLEMTDLELFNCVVSAELRIDLEQINRGNLTDNDWTRIARFVGQTSDAPLWIDDTPGITLGEIRAKARKLKKRHGLQLLVVDYLGLIETGPRENRQVAVGALTRGLKILAQQLEVPVVLVAQLNRGPEMRADKRPNIADLRESGSIENDANVVILIHRDDYYDKESPRRGEAELIVAKSRATRPQTVTVAAQLHHSRFAPMGV